VHFKRTQTEKPKTNWMGQGRTMFPGRLSGASVSEGQRFSAPPWERGAGVQLPRPARCAALTG